MLTWMSDGDGLEQLRTLTEQVAAADRQLAMLRSQRDEEIARVCSNGTSERAAARVEQQLALQLVPEEPHPSSSSVSER